MSIQIKVYLTTNNVAHVFFQLAQPFADEFMNLFSIYLLPALDLLRSHMKEILTSVDSALVMSFLYLFDWRIGPLAGRDNKPPPPPQFLKLLRKH